MTQAQLCDTFVTCCGVQKEHPHFRTLKAAFPHGVLAMSKCGHAVFVMKIGVLKERYDDIEAAGLSNDDIVRHLALVYEYIFTKVDPGDLPGGRLINIIDMEGMGVMDVQGARPPRLHMTAMHGSHACVCPGGMTVATQRLTCTKSRVMALETERRTDGARPHGR